MKTFQYGKWAEVNFRYLGKCTKTIYYKNKKCIPSDWLLALDDPCQLRGAGLEMLRVHHIDNGKTSSFTEPAYVQCTHFSYDPEWCITLPRPERIIHYYANDVMYDYPEWLDMVSVAGFDPDCIIYYISIFSKSIRCILRDKIILVDRSRLSEFLGFKFGRSQVELYAGRLQIKDYRTGQFTTISTQDLNNICA